MRQQGEKIVAMLFVNFIHLHRGENILKKIGHFFLKIQECYYKNLEFRAIIVKNMY